SDTDRRDHVAAALRLAFGEFSLRAIFGYGEEGHKKALPDTPEMQKYYAAGIEKPAIMRSSAWVADTINYGSFGVILLLVTLFFSLRELYRMGWAHRWILMPFFGVATLWGTITDYRGMVLMY